MSSMGRGQGPNVVLAALVCGIVIAGFPGYLHLPPATEDQVTAVTLPAGELVAGLICWLWGRTRRRRDGWSHTVYGLPVQWVGALLVSGSLITGGMHLWEWKHARSLAPLAEPVTPAGPEPPTAPAPKEPLVAPGNFRRRDAAAERKAMSYAVQRFPDLGNNDSAFHARFVALSAQYRETRPEMFESPDWPMKLAVETEALMRGKKP